MSSTFKSQTTNVWTEVAGLADGEFCTIEVTIECPNSLSEVFA